MKVSQPSSACRARNNPKSWPPWKRRSPNASNRAPLSRRSAMSPTGPSGRASWVRYRHAGAIAYHHIPDRYIALFVHLITCGTWEAIYLIDGLLKNETDIQPTTIHGDTQAQSTPVFALTYLLGIELMPRIRNWKDLIFFKPSKDVTYQHIEPLFRGV